MKKGFRNIITLLFAAVFFLSLAPAKVEAAAPEKTAYIGYADTSWTYQYWGEPVDTGIVGTNAEITGPGRYTLALDFTGTPEGKAPEMEFSAVMIEKGTDHFPGYFIQIESIKLDGEEIEFSKSYTSSDDGVEMRSNIYNAWTGDNIPDDSRRPDGDLTGASAVIVDPALFTGVETITVEFSFLDPDGNLGEVSTPKTGVTSMALVYGLGALVTGAYVFKRKKK